MKKEKTPNIVSLAILTLITSILWIFFSLYRVFTEKSDIKVPEEILEPLTPSLNETIISEIENKVFIEQNQIPDNIVAKETTVSKIESPSPSPEPEQATEQVNTGTPVPNGTGGLEEI
jgi:hypothetical protein